MREGGRTRRGAATKICAVGRGGPLIKFTASKFKCARVKTHFGQDKHTWSFGLKVAGNIPTLGRSVGRGTGQTERPKIGIFQATFELNAVA